ncbi:histidinol-phosphate transaminase [Aquimarina sp. TRL1]|uniref:histidinol-phosphate transaminase n=1 Tax=Aquimarina sp. (strain TRL1) TaxID=2736252 RepID=UPI00158E5AE4|nr:histidinol-phosphate transaminase [Aquimarina sp. TRL1]QKX06517.1 histidinol-phosphate transaminase [Aquimarina sp. TRL1]
MNKVSVDINKLVRKNILKLRPYSSARDEFVGDGTEMIFLDANENPFENGTNRYPDPKQRKVKKELAKLKGVTESQILLGNGSDEVLDLIFRAFCEPNKDNVITLPPTYGMYGVLADLNSVDNRRVPLSSEFQPVVDQIIETLDEQTKIIFICSPNNPTANTFAEAIVTQLLEETAVLVVIDEAYIDFADQPSWIRKMREYPNLIITQTLSKAYGLAGIRLGICYASEEIIALLEKIKPPYNVNELTQQKALERLSDQNTVEEEIKELLLERKRVARALEELSFVKHVYPSETNFLLVQVDNANQRYEELLDRGIVIRNRTNQALCENTLRFTIGTKEENNTLITTLKTL